MATQSELDQLKKWEDALDLSYQYKKKYGDSDKWHVYRQYYRGYFPGYSSSTSGILPYNLTYTMARTLIPNIYFRNPYVNITPRVKFSRDRVALDMHAKIVEATDNWLIQELNIKNEIKTGLLDCFFTNRAIWKIGYDSQYGYLPAKTEDTLGLTDTTFTAYSRKGEALEYNTSIKPGMPWSIRIDPEDIFVPFGVRTLSDCPWIVHRVIRPLEDVKADPKYKNTRDLEGTHLEQIYKDTQRADFYRQMSSVCDWVEIFEVRDLKRKEIFAFIYGYHKYLREPEEDILQIEGLPYVDITFNEDPQYYWGPSDVSIFEPQQLEVNEARTQAMLHRRVALLKFLVESGAIEQSEIDKMVSENVGPVIRVKGNPNQVASMLQPHIPADLVGWVEQIRSDVRELIGFSRQATGEIPAGRRTAQEVTIATLAKEIRLDERRDMVADALSNIIRKINQIIFDRWDDTHVVQVVGVDGAKYWIEYTRDSIVGEYNIKVDVESMTPTTKALKKKEVVELIGALAKHPRANIDYLLRTLLREYDWLDAMSVLPEAPETMAGPMSVNDYTRQQMALMQSPERLGARVRQTQNAVGGML